MVVGGLWEKVEAKTATDFERIRYRAGLEEILCWEWAEEGLAIRIANERARAQRNVAEDEWDRV